jgi:hypothetical protein
MKALAVFTIACGITLALVSSPGAKPKKPDDADPIHNVCGKVLACLLSDPCYTEDGKGNKREVTPEERKKLTEWFSDNCLIEAVNPGGGSIVH